MPVPAPARTLRSLAARTPRNRALHLSWFAFFLAFVVWFDFAPFSSTIGHHLHLTKAQLTTIGLANLGLTVPARLLVGMALDRWGPRRVFPSILLFAAVPNTVFALATSFDTLVFSRLALSVVGAGFVVGIRMVAEWWPEEEIGTAEGIYGGWGNLGGGVATVCLPFLADWLGGADGWRWSIGLMGALAAGWAVVYLVAARDTPSGTWVPPERQGALEVTSRAATVGLALLTFPVVGICGVVAYEIERKHVISPGVLTGVLVVLAVLAVAQVAQVLRVNRTALADGYPPSERWPFRAVVVCCLSYAVTFGGELAMLSILPTFFGKTWHLGVASAGAAAGTFGVMNLVTRPSGGITADATGRRRVVLVTGLCATAVVVLVMALLHASWPVGLAVLLAIAAAACLQATNGVVFSIVPQIHKRVGGQIAGLAGAYGNIGGALLLFLFLYVHAQVVFLAVGAGAVAVGLIASRLLPDLDPVRGPAAAAQPVPSVAPVAVAR